VRVTFNIPVEAARRLRELAARRDPLLRELGILAVQIEGDRVISMTMEGANNETTELIVGSSGAPPRSEPAEPSAQFFPMRAAACETPLLVACSSVVAPPLRISNQSVEFTKDFR